MDFTNIRGILFDMDGVLLDTEGAMVQAAIRGFQDYGADVRAEDFEPFFGTGSRQFFGGVAEQYGIPYSEALAEHMYACYLETFERDAVWYRDIPETVDALFRRGYRMAVASSAAAVKVFANLKATRIPTGQIEYVVTGDDILRNKPDPEIFLKAATGLGLAPGQCIAAEDSVSGIRAAVAAVACCVGIRGTYPDDALSAAGAFMVADHIDCLLDLLPGIK